MLCSLVQELINVGFIVLDECEPVCPEGQEPVKIRNCSPKESPNGCGPGSWKGFSLAILDIITNSETHRCCQNHDICYTTCGKTFEDCQSQFSECIEGFYETYSWFTALGGCNYFREAQNEVCACEDTELNLTETTAECKGTPVD